MHTQQFCIRRSCKVNADTLASGKQRYVSSLCELDLLACQKVLVRIFVSTCQTFAYFVKSQYKYSITLSTVNIMCVILCMGLVGYWGSLVTLKCHWADFLVTKELLGQSGIPAASAWHIAIILTFWLKKQLLRNLYISWANKWDPMYVQTSFVCCSMPVSGGRACITYVSK